MKIVAFGNDRRVGALVDSQIVDINRAFAQYLRGQGHERAEETAGERTPVDLKQFITVGPSAIEDAQLAIDFALLAESPSKGLTHTIGTVQIHAPWAGGRIACVGGNYTKHTMGMRGHRPGPSSERAALEEITKHARETGQWGFWKILSEVAGPDEALPFPAHSTYLDYEGEAAIVIGQRGKNISAGDIDRYVWGVTLVNDCSKRELNTGKHPMSYHPSKNFDGSMAMGPCIVVGELDCQNVEVETRVNGALRQSYNTSEMIWSFGEVLEYLSTDFTFLPGDIISGGTSAGTAADTSPHGADGTRPMDRFLKVGDSVEISSPEIGMFTTRSPHRLRARANNPAYPRKVLVAMAGEGSRSVSGIQRQGFDVGLALNS